MTENEKESPTPATSGAPLTDEDAKALLDTVPWVLWYDAMNGIPLAMCERGPLAAALRNTPTLRAPEVTDARDAALREAAEIVNAARDEGDDLRQVRDRILSLVGKGSTTPKSTPTGREDGK